MILPPLTPRCLLKESLAIDPSDRRELVLSRPCHAQSDGQSQKSSPRWPVHLIEAMSHYDKGLTVCCWARSALMLSPWEPACPRLLQCSVVPVLMRTEYAYVEPGLGQTGCL